MKVLIVFSEPFLSETLNPLRKREEEQGKALFDKLIIIDQGNMAYIKDLESLFNNAEVVLPEKFSAEPHVHYTVCTKKAKGTPPFLVTHALRHATEEWLYYPSIEAILYRNRNLFT